MKDITYESYRLLVPITYLHFIVLVSGKGWRGAGKKDNFVNELTERTHIRTDQRYIEGQNSRKVPSVR